MKRGIILFGLIILLSSFISAEIIFTESMKETYNLGDTIYVPVTIKSMNYIADTFNMDLICNNATSINFYKNGISLVPGDERKIDSSLVLIRNIIGYSSGTCRIKAILKGEYVLSNEFKISDSLNIESTLEKTEFDAGENIQITGKVTRETGEYSDGFIDVNIETADVNQNITQSGTITEGIFNMNLSLPTDLKAGTYFIKLKAYEKDSDGIITNNGLNEYEITIKQVPTNLELIFESKEMNPGETLKVKAILHDQTGEQIESSVFITIKSSKDKILEQKEVDTGDFLEYAIESNELPSEWIVYATSNKLTAEDKFSIKEKEEIEIEMLNQTILVTNTGNIPYNNTLLVKVGNTSLNINVILNVGESKKYSLSAPEGEYDVKVSDDKNEINNIMSLTGKTVEIKEISGVSSWIVFWVIVILILVAVVFIISKKVYKKPFFGNMIFRKRNSGKKPVKGNVIATNIGNKAEMSLSIKGEKQDASIICLKINKLKDILSKKGSASESIKRIIGSAEEDKVITYKNQDYLFFIFAPVKTKTFKNEKHALDTAEEIQKILTQHNKKFNEKIDFGISLNYGTIVAKTENNIFKFMSMGSLISNSKKIASLSEGEILLSKKMNDLLRMKVKTEKDMREGVPVFMVKKIKKEDEEARKFIERFVKGLEKEKKD